MRAWELPHHFQVSDRSSAVSGADVARQLAGAEQAQKRAEAASKKLGDLQAQLMARPAVNPGGGGTSPSDGGISKRQQIHAGGRKKTSGSANADFRYSPGTALRGVVRGGFHCLQF